MELAAKGAVLPALLPSLHIGRSLKPAQIGTVTQPSVIVGGPPWNAPHFVNSLDIIGPIRGPRNTSDSSLGIIQNRLLGMVGIPALLHMKSHLEAGFAVPRARHAPSLGSVPALPDRKPATLISRAFDV